MGLEGPVGTVFAHGPCGNPQEIRDWPAKLLGIQDWPSELGGEVLLGGAGGPYAGIVLVFYNICNVFEYV